MAYGGGYAGGYGDVFSTSPTILVEVDFTRSDTWVDVSDWLVDGDTYRGRQAELDRFQAGRLTVTLRDDDRRFDPANTAGPYYPDVKPMRRVRVRATYGATTYPLFLGYIDRWTAQPDGPHTATTRVEATDYFKVLARTDLPSGAYAAEVAADAPAHWYRLGEPEGTPSLYDAAAGRDLAVAGAPGAEGSLIARDENGSMLITTESDGGISGPDTLPAAVGAFSCDLVARQNTAVAGIFAGEVDAAVTRGWDLKCAVTVGDWKAASSITTTGGSVFLTGTTSLALGSAHHLAVTWDGTTARLYVDGVLEDSEALGGTLFLTGESTYLVVGGAEDGPIVNSGIADGAIDEVAVYRAALSAGRVATHAAQVGTPWDGDTPAGRAARVAAITDRTWYGESNPLAPATDFDAGTITLQPATLGSTALEHLQKVAESELGAVFVERDGTLRFRARTALVNQAPVATFTDAHGTDPAIAAYQPQYGDDLVRNTVTVSRLDGTAQTAVDQASVDEFLTAAYSLEGLVHDDDTYSRSVAQLLVSEYAQPRQRITGLTIRPYWSPDVLFPAVLALELTDTVTVAVTPQGAGAEHEQQSMVDAIAHRFGPKVWETVLTVSPALGGEAGFWQIGVAGHSEIGVTTRVYL